MDDFIGRLYYYTGDLHKAVLEAIKGYTDKYKQAPEAVIVREELMDKLGEVPIPVVRYQVQTGHFILLDKRIITRKPVRFGGTRCPM